MSWTHDLADCCRRAGGPVHVHVVAHHLGVPARRIRALVRRDGWWEPYPEVVAPPGTPRSAVTQAAAALARVRGPDPAAPVPCALARWTGAALLGVGPGAPSRPQLLVPAARRPRADGPLVTIRARGFSAEAVVEQAGLAVAEPSWLVRSCAAVAEVPLLTDLVIDLVQGGLLTLDDLAAAQADWARYPGRHRVSVVLERLCAAGRTDSRLELIARRRFAAAGVPLDRGQVAVVRPGRRPLHLDLGIARICFGIELDSMLAHSSRSQLRADIGRSNELAALPEDWRVLRATWEDLDRGWAAFLELVRTVIGEQSRRHLGRPWPERRHIAGA